MTRAVSVLSEVSTMIGQNALFSLMSHIFFIAITFYGLQSLMYSQWFKKNHVFQTQLILILLSIAIGGTASNVFLAFTGWARQLGYLFS